MGPCLESARGIKFFAFGKQAPNSVIRLEWIRFRFPLDDLVQVLDHRTIEIPKKEIRVIALIPWPVARYLQPTFLLQLEKAVVGDSHEFKIFS